MATSLLNGKWPLLYQAWQMATFLIWQLANLFMAYGHTGAQSLSIMVIAMWLELKMASNHKYRQMSWKLNMVFLLKYEVFEKRGWALEK